MPSHHLPRTKARLLRALRSPNFADSLASWFSEWTGRLTSLLAGELPAGPGADAVSPCHRGRMPGRGPPRPGPLGRSGAEGSVAPRMRQATAVGLEALTAPPARAGRGLTSPLGLAVGPTPEGAGPTAGCMSITRSHRVAGFPGIRWLCGGRDDGGDALLVGCVGVLRGGREGGQQLFDPAAGRGRSTHRGLRTGWCRRPLCMPPGMSLAG
jgi:hypothetical protein